MGFKSIVFHQKGTCCSTWAAPDFLPASALQIPESIVLLGFFQVDGVQPARQGQSVTLKLRPGRVADGVGDIDVISRDLGEGGKVKLLGLISNHVRSGCP